ncbi:hypothetical protein K493DRAFT_405538, partial [Basidiobolus meristosporus CBS 931.73]
MELGFEEPDLHVVIRVPWKRPSSFKPPSQAVWSEEIDRELWKALSRQKEETIDWEVLSREFNITIPQLLRHSATLYERKLRELGQIRRSTAEPRNFPTPSKDSRGVDSAEVHLKSPSEISQDKKHLAAIQKSYYDALKLEQQEIMAESNPSRRSLSNSGAKSVGNNEESESSDESEDVTDEQVNERLSKLQIGMPSGHPVSGEKGKEVADEQPKSPTQQDVEDASHSAGSSFSDLSDSSVTQSALEDAYLSKFNQSKLSTV